MGSGRPREGKLPSAAPATITVSNSSPTVPCAVSTATASGPARSHAVHPGPCSPASRASRNPCTPVSPPSLASATALANVTTVSRSRRSSAPSDPAASTSRREQGSSSQSTRKASWTDIPAKSDAFARVSRAATTASASAGSRPSVTSSASAAARPSTRARRIRPRAAAGDSPITSDVRSGSTSSSRSGPPATSHRSASTYGCVDGAVPSDSPRSGTTRGTCASSRARSRLPTCAPWRRTTTARSLQATPSSTWRRRSSRATAACSSEVCGAIHAVTAGSATDRWRVLSWIRSAPGKASVANRSRGCRVVPWNEKTCASGSAATTRSGAARPRRTASAASVVS